MVIGAGPAGLETARVAAIRGHEVFLFDKHPRLGGLLPLTSLLEMSRGQICWTSSNGSNGN
jgi:2,4-dienoyl-CoA reductase (NADPH2)